MGRGEEGQVEVEEAVGEEEVHRRRMKSKGEGEAEVRREASNGLVEGGAGGSPDLVGEVAAGRTYQDGTGAGEEVRRWVPWRGVAAEEGRCGHGQEEEGAGWSCDGVVVEEGHLWMEGEGGEEEPDLERITVKISGPKTPLFPAGRSPRGASPCLRNSFLTASTPPFFSMKS